MERRRRKAEKRTLWTTGRGCRAARHRIAGSDKTCDALQMPAGALSYKNPALTTTPGLFCPILFYTNAELDHHRDFPSNTRSPSRPFLKPPLRNHLREPLRFNGAPNERGKCVAHYGRASDRRAPSDVIAQRARVTGDARVLPSISCACREYVSASSCVHARSYDPTIHHSLAKGRGVGHTLAAYTSAGDASQKKAQ